MQERSLDFARDDDTGIALSKHIRWTLCEINPFPPTVISSAVEKSSLHSALSCSLRRSIPVFRYHTYDIIPSCKKDPSTSLGMTIREALSKHIRWTLREINPFPHTVISSAVEKSSLHSALSCSFRKTFPLFRAFLLPSQMDSRFLLSHIRHYPLLQERSLDFARDDDTGIALSKHIRCTLHEINPFPHTVMRGAARNLPSTLLFLASFRKRFPLFRYHTYSAIPVCQKDPSTSLGMTIQE